MSRRSHEFNRPPRSWVPLPDETLKVPEPPQVPNAPQRPSLLMALMPTFMMAIPTVVNVLSQEKPNWLSLLSMGGAVLYPSFFFLNYRNQKKAHAKEVAQIDQAFKEELEAFHKRLAQLQRDQLRGATIVNPSTSVLLERAQRRDDRLWERRPRDPDFLSLRVGTYDGPTTYAITFHEADTRDPRKKQANAVAQPYASVPDLPCTINLPDLGSIGIAGRSGFRSGLARTLICNLTVHHAPDEVRLYAIYKAKSDDPTKWDWLVWLPHAKPISTNLNQIANTTETIYALMSQLLEELNRREQLLRNREKSEETWPYLVVLIKDLELARGQEAINLILKRGKELRASAIFLADEGRAIPGGCGARLESTGSGHNGFLLRLDQPGTAPINGRGELTDIAAAEALARGLSPIDFETDEGGDLPSGVRLSSLFNVASAREIDLKKIWAAHADPKRQLVAAIGRASGDRLLELDLHITKHGTHGLIAGTTGAGKTVLLSTVIASLAASNSPRLVNFVIIDMKGDNDLELLSHLPHTVGFASVLNKSMGPNRIRSYIGRAIIALDNEIKRRMQILSDAGQNDIFEYNRIHPDTPLPHLMVIIDEFAVLKKQFSELMDKLVDVSALGRAPGVHLILCTQSPSGIVSDKIWANTQFRICLRVANVDESRSILHRQDAAFLPVKPQGRAFLQASGGEVEIFEPFQVAWSGGRVGTVEEEQSVSQTFEIAEIKRDGTRKILYRHDPAEQKQAEQGQQPTELQYFIDLATQTAIADGLQLPLRGPWLPPLAESIALEALLAQSATYRHWTGAGWTEAATELRLCVPLGLVDNPVTQQQFPLLVDLGREHVHMWLGGVMGAGKSTCLRSLIVALAQTHTPDEVHVYLLSFGKQALKPLSRFPHVGAVIQVGEVERLQRLFIWLDREVTRRRNLFLEAGVDSIAGYRRTAGQSLPSLIVIIENFGELVKEAARVNELQDVIDHIARLLGSGKECDLHFVFSTMTANLYRDLATNVNGRLALRQQARGDYSELLAIRTGVELDDIAGRGLWRMGNEAFECQLAAPTRGADDVQHGERLAALAKEMNRVWTEANGARPRPIEILPAHLPLGQLLAVPTAEDWAQIPAQEALPTVIGLDDDLQWVSLDLMAHGPSFLLVGAPKCGKTALLETLAVSLAANYSPAAAQFYGIDLRRDRLSRTLNGLANTVRVADAPDLAVALFDHVLAEIAARNQRRTDPAYKAGTVFWPRLILLADDFSRQLSDVSKENDAIFDRLDQCYKQGRSVGFHLIVAGDGSSLSSMSQPFMQQLKAGQRGFVFTSAVDNASLLGVRVQRVAPKNILPGRAFLVQPNGARLMQVAQFEPNAPEASDLKRWLKQCQERSTPAPAAEAEGVPA
jgi:DNA segregation ATPase FtsK/SpoIIIE, S-DNA-T family